MVTLNMAEVISMPNALANDNAAAKDDGEFLKTVLGPNEMASKATVQNMITTSSKKYTQVVGLRKR